MPAKIPTKTQKLIRQRVYAAADKANYLKSSRTDNAVLLEHLCADPEVGGLVSKFVPKEKVRTYIKDAVLNRYAKEHKATERPSQDDQVKFCAEQFLVTNFSVLERNRDTLVLKSSSAPIYAIVVEGTMLKWETALRKGLVYVAAHPLGQKTSNTVHIVLSLFMGGGTLTPSDKNLLQTALARAGAVAYLWNSRKSSACNASVDSAHSLAAPRALELECGSDEDGLRIAAHKPSSGLYVDWLPSYTMRAACGKFGADQLAEPTGWVRVRGLRRPNKKLYVVRAAGDSMEPLIRDGQLCVFEDLDKTCESGDIVLAEHAAIPGDEPLGSYAIKRISYVKKGAEYTDITLYPQNAKYKPIPIPNEGECVRDFKVVGVYRKDIVCG